MAKVAAGDRSQRERVHLVEAAMRDLANLDVIQAADRLVALPGSPAEMRTAMADLEKVKEFVLKRVPPSLRDTAKEIFMEHVETLRQHFGVITGGKA